MRKLILFLHSSLDGYAEGPNGPMDISFVAYNEELEAFANKVLSTADTILWGRNTYEMMHSYWPTLIDNDEATAHERNHAKWINDVEKVVCSTTLEEARWHNTTLVKENIIDYIKTLKQQDGKDIVILGSPRLAHYLMHYNLIDAFKITVSPNTVGSGLPLFNDNTLTLNLIESNVFSTGALGLHYELKQD